jgi:hypothetical protein
MLFSAGVNPNLRNPLAYAQQVSTRQKRRKAWVYAAGIPLFVLLIAAVWAAFSGDWRGRLLWLLPAAIALASLKWLRSYSKGCPNCPCCHNDITNCPAAFCHACGQPLSGVPCERCGADPNWTAAFQDIGLRQPIRHCPGCGVYLNTQFYRHELDPD